MSAMTADAALHSHLRDRLTRLRRVAEDVIGELALTVYWAHREGMSVEDIAGLVLWPADQVRAALERTAVDAEVDALIQDGPELDWNVCHRAPFAAPGSDASDGQDGWDGPGP